jgi:hypothetical protein
MTQVIGGIQQMANETISFVPNLLAAIVILFIGWIVGRLLGKGVAVLFNRLGVDDALAKTSVGEAIGNTGVRAPMGSWCSSISSCAGSSTSSRSWLR